MGLARAAQMLALAPVLAAPAAHAGNTVPPARLENPLAAIPLSQLATTRDRPLFVPDRRPPPPVAVARDTAPPPPAEPPSLSLLAIILACLLITLGAVLAAKEMIFRKRV